MKYCSLFLILITFLSACKKEEIPVPYAVSGQVTNGFGTGLEGVNILVNGSETTVTDEQGNWALADLSGQNTISANLSGYTFDPASLQVDRYYDDLVFTATHTPTQNETRVFNWFDRQQLPNGLLESSEDGNFVSLYDNALAAMVFMLKGDYPKAEKVFDFFNARINSELLSGNGGFSQFRDRNGVPGNHRWMGDNAWLLIALNNYKASTGNATYDALATGISNWLLGLQDSDGGLFAGYGTDNTLLTYKVTEGNIDAFNAIEGYGVFHQQLLQFLENDRWDPADKNLMAWPGNPTYKYALDNQSWSYCIFEDYPVSALHSASRFLTTQTATINGATITGYDIDEDRDAVFLEGTGQMALAFKIAGLESDADLYLNEMEKVLVQSPSSALAYGFPYSSNIGTGYGSDPLWSGADTKIALSGGAWYLFASYGFNPFAVGREKNVPLADRFWMD